MGSAASQPAARMLVLGDARRAVLVARLTECLRGWLREWNASGALSFSLDAIPAHGESIGQRVAAATHLVVGSGAIGSGTNATQLYVIVSEAGLSDALGLPRHMQIVASNDGGLAGSVVERVVCSLAQTVLAKGLVKGGASNLASCGVDEIQRLAHSNHWWLITVSLAQGGKSLLLAMTPELLEQLSPVATPKFATAVDKRRSAIGEESVRIEAILGEADISVGELASLAVNDVIVLRSLLSRPATLVTANGRQIANASLGRVGNKRAVVIAK